MTNEVLHDMRFISLHLQPFQEITRNGERFQIRFVRLDYDMLQLRTVVEVQGVRLHDDGTVYSNRLRKFTFPDPKRFPGWMADLAGKHTPPEFSRALEEIRRQNRADAHARAQQKAAERRKRILDKWASDRHAPLVG